MKEEYAVIDKFNISGRGVAVVIDEITKRIVGTEYKAEISCSNGTTLIVSACKELLLNRIPTSVEKEAYLIKSMDKSEIADDAVIAFL